MCSKPYLHSHTRSQSSQAGVQKTMVPHCRRRQTRYSHPDFCFSCSWTSPQTPHAPGHPSWLEFLAAITAVVSNGFSRFKFRELKIHSPHVTHMHFGSFDSIRYRYIYIYPFNLFSNRQT